MSELAREFREAIAWLAHEMERVQFGDIGITLVIHAGRLTRVVRTITEKTLPKSGNPFPSDQLSHG